MNLEFLEPLETRVREAAERLEELIAENARLKKEIEKLERDKSAAKGAKGSDAAEKVEKAWAKERDEIRKRAEALVERLSAMLSPGPSSS
jgi:hypothetical protein